MEKHFFIRSISVALASVYLSTTCLFAHKPETTIWEERKFARLPSNFSLPNLPKVEPTLPRQIKESIPKQATSELLPIFKSLPATHGTIQKILVPKDSKNGRIVIHIQDVHMNSEAQQNIGRAVQALLDNSLANMIALEGAFAPIDLAPFRAYPLNSTKKVANYLLRENKISGPIYSALTSPKPLPQIFGIDDRVHYDANVAAYRQSYSRMDEYQQQLNVQKIKLEEEKRNVFSKSLLAFDHQVQSYIEGNLSLGKYIELISRHTGERPFAVDIFLEAFHLESRLNFTSVESERGRLLSVLLSKLTTSQTQELIAVSVAYRLGNLPHVDFYSRLKILCQQNGIALSHYPAMNSYLQYVLLTDQINSAELFQSIKKMESSIYSSLANSESEKQLVAQSNHLSLAQKLLEFSLTKDEWNEYKTTIHQPLTTNHRLNLSSFERFYVEAELRDKAMAENLLTSADLSNSEVIILVTGGFHSDGIARQLSEKGTTVLTWVPKLTKVDSKNGSAYLSVFAQEKTPLDQLFDGEKLFLAKFPLPPNDQPIHALHDLVGQSNGGDDKVSREYPKGTLEGDFKDGEIAEVRYVRRIGISKQLAISAGILWGIFGLPNTAQGATVFTSIGGPTWFWIGVIVVGILFALSMSKRFRSNPDRDEFDALKSLPDTPETLRKFNDAVDSLRNSERTPENRYRARLLQKKMTDVVARLLEKELSEPGKRVSGDEHYHEKDFIWGEEQEQLNQLIKDVRREQSNEPTSVNPLRVLVVDREIYSPPRPEVNPKTGKAPSPDVESSGVESPLEYVRRELKKLKGQDSSSMPDLRPGHAGDLSAFENEYFHLVRCRAALDHLLNLGRGAGVDVAIDGIVRVLKPGNFFHVAVPEGTGVTIDEAGRPVQHYTEDEFRDLLTRNGLTVLEVGRQSGFHSNDKTQRLFAYTVKSQESVDEPPVAFGSILNFIGFIVFNLVNNVVTYTLVLLYLIPISWFWFLLIIPAFLWVPSILIRLQKSLMPLFSEFLSEPDDSGYRTFNSMKEGLFLSNRDPLLRSALKEIRGLELTENHMEVENIGVNHSQKKILYTLFIGLFRAAMRYLVTRRALGNFVEIVGVGRGRVERSWIAKTNSPGVRMFRQLFVEYELFKRGYLFPTSIPYILLTQVGEMPRMLYEAIQEIPKNGSFLKNFIRDFWALTRIFLLGRPGFEDKPVIKAISSAKGELLNQLLGTEELLNRHVGEFFRETGSSLESATPEELEDLVEYLGMHLRLENKLSNEEAQQLANKIATRNRPLIAKELLIQSKLQTLARLKDLEGLKSYLGTVSHKANIIVDEDERKEFDNLAHKLGNDRISVSAKEYLFTKGRINKAAFEEMLAALNERKELKGAIFVMPKELIAEFLSSEGAPSSLLYRVNYVALEDLRSNFPEIQVRNLGLAIAIVRVIGRSA